MSCVGNVYTVHYRSFNQFCHNSCIENPTQAICINSNKSRIATSCSKLHERKHSSYCHAHVCHFSTKRRGWNQKLGWKWNARGRTHGRRNRMSSHCDGWQQFPWPFCTTPEFIIRNCINASKFTCRRRVVPWYEDRSCFHILPPMRPMFTNNMFFFYMYNFNLTYVMSYRNKGTKIYLVNIGYKK